MEETLSMNNEDGKRSSIVPRPKGIPMTNMGVSRIQSLCMLKRCAMTRLVISKSYSPRLKGHASARLSVVRQNVEPSVFRRTRKWVCGHDIGRSFEVCGLSSTKKLLPHNPSSRGVLLYQQYDILFHTFDHGVRESKRMMLI